VSEIDAIRSRWEDYLDSNLGLRQLSDKEEKAREAWWSARDIAEVARVNYQRAREAFENYKPADGKEVPL
jgi:hypothetical protein